MFKKVIFRINDDPDNTYEYRGNVQGPFLDIKNILRDDLLEDEVITSEDSLYCFINGIELIDEVPLGKSGWHIGQLIDTYINEKPRSLLPQEALWLGKLLCDKDYKDAIEMLLNSKDDIYFLTCFLREILGCLKKNDQILINLGKKENFPDYLYLPRVLYTLLLQYDNINNNEVAGLVYFIIATWNYFLYNTKKGYFLESTLVQQFFVLCTSRVYQRKSDHELQQIYAFALSSFSTKDYLLDSILSSQAPDLFLFICQSCSDEKILAPLLSGISNILYLYPDITENATFYDVIHTLICKQETLSTMKSLAIYNISILGTCLIHNKKYVNIYKQQQISMTLYKYMNDVSFEPFNYLLLKNIYRCVAIFTKEKILLDDYISIPSFFDLFIKYIHTNQLNDQEYILINVLILSHLSYHEEYMNKILTLEPKLINILYAYMNVNLNNHHILSNIFIIINNILYYQNSSLSSALSNQFPPFLSKLAGIKYTVENIEPILYFITYLYNNHSTKAQFLNTWTSINSVLADFISKSKEKLESRVSSFYSELCQSISNNQSLNVSLHLMIPFISSYQSIFKSCSPTLNEFLDYLAINTDNMILFNCTITYVFNKLVDKKLYLYPKRCPLKFFEVNFPQYLLLSMEFDKHDLLLDKPIVLYTDKEDIYLSINLGVRNEPYQSKLKYIPKKFQYYFLTVLDKEETSTDLNIPALSYRERVKEDIQNSKILSLVHSPDYIAPSLPAEEVTVLYTHIDEKEEAKKLEEEQFEREQREKYYIPQDPSIFKKNSRLSTYGITTYHEKYGKTSKNNENHESTNQFDDIQEEDEENEDMNSFDNSLTEQIHMNTNHNNDSTIVIDDENDKDTEQTLLEKYKSKYIGTKPKSLSSVFKEVHLDVDINTIKSRSQERDDPNENNNISKPAILLDNTDVTYEDASTLLVTQEACTSPNTIHTINNMDQNTRLSIENAEQNSVLDNNNNKTITNASKDIPSNPPVVSPILKSLKTVSKTTQFNSQPAASPDSNEDIPLPVTSPVSNEDIPLPAIDNNEDIPLPDVDSNEDIPLPVTSPDLHSCVSPKKFLPKPCSPSLPMSLPPRVPSSPPMNSIPVPYQGLLHKLEVNNNNNNNNRDSKSSFVIPKLNHVSPQSKPISNNMFISPKLKPVSETYKAETMNTNEVRSSIFNTQGNTTINTPLSPSKMRQQFPNNFIPVKPSLPSVPPPSIPVINTSDNTKNEDINTSERPSVSQLKNIWKQREEKTLQINKNMNKINPMTSPKTLSSPVAIQSPIAIQDTESTIPPIELPMSRDSLANSENKVPSTYVLSQTRNNLVNADLNQVSVANAPQTISVSENEKISKQKEETPIIHYSSSQSVQNRIAFFSSPRLGPIKESPISTTTATATTTNVATTTTTSVVSSPKPPIMDVKATTTLPVPPPSDFGMDTENGTKSSTTDMNRQSTYTFDSILNRYSGDTVDKMIYQQHIKVVGTNPNPSSTSQSTNITTTNTVPNSSMKNNNTNTSIKMTLNDPLNNNNNKNQEEHKNMKESISTMNFSLPSLDVSAFDLSQIDIPLDDSIPDISVKPQDMFDTDITLDDPHFPPTLPSSKPLSEYSEDDINSMTSFIEDSDVNGLIDFASDTCYEDNDLAVLLYLLRTKYIDYNYNCTCLKDSFILFIQLVLDNSIYDAYSKKLNTAQEAIAFLATLSLNNKNCVIINQNFMFIQTICACIKLVLYLRDPENLIYNYQNTCYFLYNLLYLNNCNVDIIYHFESVFTCIFESSCSIYQIPFTKRIILIINKYIQELNTRYTPQNSSSFADYYYHVIEKKHAKLLAEVNYDPSFAQFLTSFMKILQNLSNS